MVLKADFVKQWFDLFWFNLSVWGGNWKQFAAGELLGRTAFVYVDVCRLGADYCMMRRGGSFQTQHVGARAAKNEKHLRIFPKLVAKELDCARCVRIIAIGNHMAIVGSSYSLHNLRMDAGVVIAGKTTGWL